MRMAKKPTDLDDVLNVITDFAGMVDKRFDKLENRFDNLEGRFDNLENRFDKLEIQVFKQGEDIKELKANVAEINKKVDHIYEVLDGHMKRIEDILQDNKVRDYQQERMERWIFQLADASGIKLKYE